MVFSIFYPHGLPKLRLTGFCIRGFSLKKPTKCGSSGNFLKGANNNLTLWISTFKGGKVRVLDSSYL